MWSFLPSRARLLLRWSSLSAAAIVRLHITPCTAAITVILAMRIPATSALAREATTGLGGAIAITAGIMAGGRGTGGAADTAGMAADGTGIIDSESRSGHISVLELCLFREKLILEF